MKKSYLFLFAGLAAIMISSCKKSNNSQPQVDFPTLEGKVLVDFAGVLANPNYADLQVKAGLLQTSITTLVATPTDANLQAAQTAWRNTRQPWEQCEGYLFGPVEDNSYDPIMDTWPVDKNELDSLITSTNPLQVADLQNLQYTLTGFHAIEYIIFGVGGTQKAANITDRQKLYLTSLAQNLYNTTTQLKNSWDPSSANNYTSEVVNAGAGSTTYTSRKAVFTAIVASMADICSEVSSSKMETPFVARDSTLDESSFSHNSVADFKNNITGIYNAYMCTYNGKSGTGLNQLVAAKNAALDNKLQAQMKAAIASFNTITVSYELAIYQQRNQIATVQSTINTLQATLEGDLADFVNANIKD